MATKNSVLPIAMTSINATGVSTAYATINASGTTNSCIILRLVNNTNKNLIVSFDGINDHDFVKAGEILELSPTSNYAGIPGFKKGTVIHVKSDAAGTGLAYLSGYYINT